MGHMSYNQLNDVHDKREQSSEKRMEAASKVI